MSKILKAICEPPLATRLTLMKNCLRHNRSHSTQWHVVDVVVGVNVVVVIVVAHTLFGVVEKHTGQTCQLMSAVASSCDAVCFDFCVVVVAVAVVDWPMGHSIGHTGHHGIPP